MKKLLLSASVALALASIPASADALKNSLMPVAKEAKPAINLDNLNVAAAPAKLASRPATATVATVNGLPVKKKDADKFLALASKGQVTDIDLLPKKQKVALLNGMAASVLIEDKANKAVPKEIKSKLIARYWAEQKMAKIKVSDKEAKAFYEKNKKVFKGKDGEMLSFDKVEKYVQMQLKQQKFNEELMKNAKVIIK